MKLREARQAYYNYSKAASEIARKLGFAGIALVWLFKGDINGVESIPAELRPPMFLLVISRSLDFVQYLWGSLAWSVFARFKELKKVGGEDEFKAPGWINWLTLICFWLKCVIMAIAYWYLLRFLGHLAI